MAECPICGKPVDGQLKPFCSRRCADIDLGRWLKGDYPIAGAPANPATSSIRSEKDLDED